MSDQIVANDIRAAGAIHQSAMFDAMRACDVADRLVELSATGALRLTGGGGRLVYEYWRATPDRMTRAERQALYVRTLGLPRNAGGSAGVQANREFGDLWLRFVSSVSGLARQLESPGVSVPPAAGHDEVRRGARDLASNASRHGRAARVAAGALARQARMLTELFSDPEIQTAFGVRGPWQLIEHVSRSLGESRSMVTYRTMAVCGGVVFAWLATRPAAFWKAAGNALDPVQLETKRRGGDRAVKPSDYDLADACEQWLAVVASTIDQDGGLGADDLGGRAPAAGLSVTRQAAHTLIAKNAAGAKLLPPALQEQLTRDMVGVTEYLAALKSSAAFAELLAQVDFPRFVADLMAGVFDAIVDMNVQQMKAYRELLAAAAASLARFRDPDSDETRLLAHLCDLWPPICRELSGVTAPAGAGPHPALDSIAAGAWRRLASSRQQLLATFVLMAAAAIKASPAASRP